MTSLKSSLRSFSSTQAKLHVGHSVPKTMKFMKHNEVKDGDPNFFESTCDTPEYNPENERLIKIEAAAANRADLLQVSEFDIHKLH